MGGEGCVATLTIDIGTQSFKLSHLVRRYSHHITCLSLLFVLGSEFHLKTAHKASYSPFSFQYQWRVTEGTSYRLSLSSWNSPLHLPLWPQAATMKWSIPFPRHFRGNEELMGSPRSFHQAQAKKAALGNILKANNCVLFVWAATLQICSPEERPSHLCNPWLLQVTRNKNNCQTYIASAERLSSLPEISHLACYGLRNLLQVHFCQPVQKVRALNLGLFLLLVAFAMIRWC